MYYDIKFNLSVLSHLDNGSTQKETSKLFGVSMSSINKWKRLHKSGVILVAKVRLRKPKRIAPDKLRAYVREHPDAYLQE